MSENLENLENVETTAATEESVELVSQEAFANADETAVKGKKGKKAKKPLSKGAKIGIIAGATVGVIILILIITLVAILFKPNAPSGPVDDGAVVFIANEIGVATGAELVLSDSFVGATEFTCDSTKATFEDKTIGGVVKKVMKVKAASGEFNLTFKAIIGDKDSTIKSITIPVKINDGTNVNNITEFTDAIAAKKTVINVLANFVTESKKGFALHSSIINGNGFTLDATTISAVKYLDAAGKKVSGGDSTIFDIAEDAVVTVRDFHMIGERIQKVEGKDFSLDEFEGNGEFFSIYGDNGKRPNVTIDHCITENNQKHFFINSADVTIKNSLLRNGADAIIAVETNAKTGAVLNVENNIISNSVVAGILFCGWTDVGADKSTTCTLNVKGFLDIYNWKDTKTTKLIPATEGAVATLVNNVVGEQIKILTKDPESVKQYMVKLGGEYFVHIGIIILATPNLNANLTEVKGIDIAKGDDPVGFVKRKFPIPSFANAIARTCELIGYNQSTAGKANAVQPKTGYANSKNFYNTLNMRIVK